MKNRIVVKAYDNSGTLDDTHQKILNMATMNFAAMTSALIVGSKGEGGDGAALNPVEDCFCGIDLIWQQSIPDGLAEECGKAMERRLTTFYEMSGLDMKVEVEVR
ncbi:hypothetical protein QWT69_16880 [Sporosarcina oncorhynchi]|uniref:OsmC-like protein n=1 Tax=Sporosarcina oncorhynchi TaxID=3056444 RepID=A0ABZ0L7X5_9BACL|nr:hypothetical protein [Sporosarcina sp. T2O-4]WOV87499.1 hypothetical protein QWT69_16880 [Sporosarcina sp. T2O-4]